MISGAVQEVCYLERFQARCQADEVILMKTAMYGQMRPARCYEDTGDYTCTSDVLAHADKMCSGRRECSIQVPNEHFENSKSCIRSIKGYFEGDYTCTRGKLVKQVYAASKVLHGLCRRI